MAENESEQPKAPSSSKREPAPVEGTDGYIVMDIFMPGYAPFQRRVTLKNIKHNTTAAQRTPINTLMRLREALKKAFGVQIE